MPKRSAHWTVGNPNPDLVDKIAILLSTLSLDRWHILRELANHLALLDMHSKENKMTLSNLRLILSPTLHVSPAMLQLLVEQRRFLFDKERAHALATPSTSPVELVPPRANVDGDSIHSAPPAIKSFAKQQETLDASLAAAWEVDDFPKQRLSSQSGPLPPIASRFTAGPSSASARAPSPSSTSTRSRAVSKSNGSNTTFWVQKQSSDAGSTTRGSSTSVATFDRAGRRRSRSLSALADSVIAPHASPEPPVGMLPRAPQQSEAEDSGTEDLEVSSASSSSDLEARRSIMTVETSAEEDQKFGRKGSVQSEESAEILQASTAAKGSRSPSPAPSLRLSFDTFSSSFLDGEVAALPWTSSEKR